MKQIGVSKKAISGMLKSGKIASNERLVAEGVRGQTPDKVIDDVASAAGFAYDFQGGPAQPPYAGQVVILQIDELKDYSTSCGTTGNKPFTLPVIAFLKKHSALSFAVAALPFDENGATLVREICGMGIKWKMSPQKNREAFSERVNANEGSLRAECSIRDGWDTYESE